MTFVEWLRAQAKGDPNSEQACAPLYAYGPYFVRTLGDDPPDPVAFKTHLVELDTPSVEQEALLRVLVIADATWRTDSLSDDPDDPSDDPDDDVAPPPTAAIVPKPLKPVKCGFRDTDGKTCRAYAVDGAARCADHGGAITDPAVRGSLLLLAYAQLTKGTKTAVETLINVMETSSNDLARVTAAKELLDRAGLSVDQHHTVTVGHAATDTREDALQRIKAHLDTTKSRLLPPPPPSDDEIVDAEIVEADSAPTSK